MKHLKLSYAGLLIILCCTFTPRAGAHPMRFGLFDLTEGMNGTVETYFKYSGTDKKPAGVVPLLPGHCKPVGHRVESVFPYGILLAWIAECGESGLVGSEVRIDGLEEPGLQILLRVSLSSGREFQTVLNHEKPGILIPAPDEVPPVFQHYVRLGIEHILLGPEHLFFVLALVLLVRRQRKLIRTVTAFTIGHSVTLSLATFQLLVLPSPPVEAVIAISIILLAGELLRDPTAPPTLTRRHPELITGGFGLFHGLGFAGVLGQIGLPKGDMLLALLSFNLGVEIGQLIFICLLLPALALIDRTRVTWPSWAPRVIPYLIGTIAAYWFMLRVVAFAI